MVQPFTLRIDMQITIDEYKDLVKSIREMTSSADDRINYRVHEQMAEELRFYQKFMFWVKQTHPDVWEGWKALKDIEEEV